MYARTKSGRQTHFPTFNHPTKEDKMRRIITTTLLIAVSAVAGFSVASFKDDPIETMNTNLANGGACSNFHYEEGTLTITATGSPESQPVLYTLTVENVDEHDIDLFQDP